MKNVLKSRSQSTINLSFWGCINSEGMGTITVVNCNTNAAKYIDIIANKAWPVISRNLQNKLHIPE